MIAVIGATGTTGKPIGPLQKFANRRCHPATLPPCHPAIKELDEQAGSGLDIAEFILSKRINREVTPQKPV